MNNKFFYSLFIIAYSNVSAQKDVNAKIIIDENANLQITQNFKPNNKNIYLFPKYISLNDTSVKFIADETANFSSYEIENVDQVNFALNSDKAFFSNDFFITTSRYLGTNKNEFFKEKKFDLDIISKKYKIIYPSNEDLKQKFISEPVIVGGNFKLVENKGFKIYYLEKETKLSELIKGSDEMEKAFEMYKNYFGNKDKPTIVFAPIDGRSITNEGIIIYNNKSLKKEFSTTISHEIGHIWFGEDGVIFRENLLTEGFTEFLALNYLTSKYGEDKVEKIIKEKYYATEGLKNFTDINMKVSDKQKADILSYSLLPLFLHSKQKKDKNFINIVADFYKYKNQNRKTSLDELNYYLQSKGLETLFTDKIPDFFISPCNSSNVCIYSTSEKNIDVEVDYISNNNEKSRKVINITNKSPQVLDTEKIKKIIVDPNYKIQQVSRLNDIWNNDEDNIFNKNRYFDIKILNPEIAKISNDVANFFTSQENIGILKSIIVNEEQRKIIDNLKEKFLKSSNTLLTGAVTSFAENKNIIFLAFAFYDELKTETNVLKFSLKLDEKHSKLESVKIYE
ncbi:hypothetical protein [Chryseobacterium sp. 3008163]|uniref:hypothetical protein n=1 Tax=Chryseobacterium sp. 3008163 TaxID=2478663 RepID=UPI000F0C6C44|nr:hypothetical protein [Chryseobacterium sp. 3008163]AYM99294.1 hypothetical protein EAG08_02160 [Chryseobacterium sp. 3008163]